MIDETEKPSKRWALQNVTLHQTNELLAKVNVLADDITEKLGDDWSTFTAVADLSESVSDLNQHVFR